MHPALAPRACVARVRCSQHGLLAGAGSPSAAKLPASATSPVLGTPQVWTSQALGLHCSVCQSSEPVFRALGA